DAHGLLEDAGAEVTRVGGRASYVELVAPDSDALSAVVERVSGATWPLPADTAVRIRQSDDSEYQASFEAGEWEDRAPLLRDLWDAGFVDVEYRDDYGDLSTALVIGPESVLTTAAGRDYLVMKLRGAGWVGSTRISLDTGPQ